MKNAPEYAKRIKQLNAKLKKDGGKAQLEVVDDSTKALLMGVLCNYASEQRAAVALRKLFESVVDTNELRVTPVADMVATIGADFPKARRAATEISLVLNSIFNALHHLDISFLKSQAKKATLAFLQKLDGLTPHAATFFRSRYLNQSDIPLDENMYGYLVRSGCLPEGTSVEDAEKFVTNQFNEKDGANFYAMFKKFAASHAPRKAARKAEPALVGASGAGEAEAEAPAPRAKSASSSRAPARSRTKSASSPARPKAKNSANRKTRGRNPR